MSNKIRRKISNKQFTEIGYLNKNSLMGKSLVYTQNEYIDRRICL